MSQAVWTLGIVGGLVLAGVTLYLIWLNWNAQLGGTLLSVALGGTVTLFIAVFSQLKETEIDRSFDVWVPVDTRIGLPLHPEPPTAGADLADVFTFLRGMRFRSIAVQAQFPKPKEGEHSAQVTPGPMAAPDDATAMRDACRQLVEYALLEDMRDSQSVAGATAPEVDGWTIPSVQGPRPAVTLSDVPPDRMLEQLESSRFLPQDPFRLMWKHRPFRLPPGATIRRRHIPTSAETGITKDLIVIERPDYYRGVITLESLGDHQVSAQLTRYRVVVSMKATFFKLTAGSAATADAKTWFEWMFRTLAEMNTGA